MPDQKIICPQCGGEIPAGAARCPYCGSAYAPEAEKEYMRKLGGVRRELEKVGDVGEEITRREAGKLGKRVILIIAAVLALAALVSVVLMLRRSGEEKKNREEYLWQAETLPHFNELFKTGKYEELTAAFEKARDEGHDLYNWEHYGFCQIYGETTFAADYKAARDDGIFRKNDANELLYLELVFRGVPLREDIPKEDRKILAPFLEPFENDLAEIYQMTEDDLREFDAQLEKYNGYPTFEACELYVENHPEILLEETEPD